jgi:DNA-binding transcriptional LysR family regulator
LGFIEGAQTHPELRVQPWLVDELVIVAAPSHPLATQRTSLKQLAEADWILRELGSGTRQAADAWLLPALGELRVAFELGSTQAIKELAAAGAGLACVSRHVVAQDLRAGSLVQLQVRLPRGSARRRLAIVTRKGRQLGHAAQAFMRHCMAAGERAA